MKKANSGAEAGAAVQARAYIPPHLRTPHQERVYKFRDSWQLLILFLPCLIYYLMFNYAPLWGISIAFMDYRPFKGLSGSAWVGLKHFTRFFKKHTGMQPSKYVYSLKGSINEDTRS